MLTDNVLSNLEATFVVLKISGNESWETQFPLKVWFLGFSVWSVWSVWSLWSVWVYPSMGIPKHGVTQVWVYPSMGIPKYGYTQAQVAVAAQPCRELFFQKKHVPFQKNTYIAVFGEKYEKNN